jgi:hypothetical protein
MADSQVFDVGAITTALDGLKVTVGVDYDSVSVSGGNLGFRLTLNEAEHFARAFTEACWRAGYHERMRHDQGGA